MAFFSHQGLGVGKFADLSQRELPVVEAKDESFLIKKTMNMMPPFKETDSFHQEDADRALPLILAQLQLIPVELW